MSGRPLQEPIAPRRTIPWPWLIAFTALAAVGIVLHSPLTAVSRLEVFGVVRSEAVSRIAGTGIGEGALLLWVDSGRIEDAVAEDPWVMDVTVDRVWPNRIVVEVLERHPAVWIEGLSHWMLVSADGVVLEVASGPTPDVVQARIAFPDAKRGGRPADPVWEEVVAMAVVLGSRASTATARLEMRGTELWTSVGGYEVRFGHPVDLADKGRALLALLGETIPAGSRIDVSSPERPAVDPGEPSS